MNANPPSVAPQGDPPEILGALAAHLLERAAHLAYWTSPTGAPRAGNRRFSEVEGLVDLSLSHEVCQRLWSREQREHRAMVHLGADRDPGVWIEIVYTALWSPTGTPLGIVGLGEDVTARHRRQAQQKHQESRLRRLHKLEVLNDVLPGASHSFSNLLTTIIVQADLLRQSSLDADGVRASSEEIIEAVERGRQLCAQINACNGEEQPLLEEQDLNAQLRQWLPLFKARLPAHVTLTATLSDSPAWIDGDQVLLRQAILSLVGNAVEAIGDKLGEIHLLTRKVKLPAKNDANLPPGNYLALEISDDGHGVPSSIRGQIFSPFFSTRAAHNGLGLDAARRTARGHRGEITVESEYGHGATFCLYLPERAATAKLTPTPGAEPTFEGRCLLVDDEDGTRRALATLMRSVGFEVQEARDGLEGVLHFKEAPDPYSVVLMDVSMPGMGGLEALSHMRAIDKKIPTVLMSGYAKQSLDSAVFGRWRPVFLQKPFTAEMLFEAVVEALASR